MCGQSESARSNGASEAAETDRESVRSNAKPDQRLSRRQRLTRSREFQEAYEQGHRWFGKYIVLWLRSGDDASLRLGVVASRKVGRAVTRTRAKRRLREIFRKHRHLLQTTSDVVLIARRGIVEAGWQEVVDDFTALAKDAGIWSGEQSGV